MKNKNFILFLFSTVLLISCNRTDNNNKDVFLNSLNRGMVEVLSDVQVGYVIGDNMCGACFEKDIRIFDSLPDKSEIIIFALSKNHRTIKTLFKDYQQLYNRIIYLDEINTKNIQLPLIVEVMDGQITNTIPVYSCERDELKNVILKFSHH